ncbi:chloride channel protein CLC-e isoform X1 [Tanacetum coccineum]
MGWTLLCSYTPSPSPSPSLGRSSSSLVFGSFHHHHLPQGRSSGYVSFKSSSSSLSSWRRKMVITRASSSPNSDEKSNKEQDKYTVVSNGGFGSLCCGSVSIMGWTLLCSYTPSLGRSSSSLVFGSFHHHHLPQGRSSGYVSFKSSSSSSSSWRRRMVITRASSFPPPPPPHSDEKSNEEQGAGVIVGSNGIIISACFVGLLTGLSVVLFNLGVHEIRDVCWDGIPSRGGLRPGLTNENSWERIVLIPTFGGLVVSLLNTLRTSALLSPDDDDKQADSSSGIKAVVLKPLLKAVAAAVTLGTGNSLGPEGPSVDIGASIAKGVASSSFFTSSSKSESNNTSNAALSITLKAAGSAAGISSGFNAAVAGCFFAVESVLWPSPASESSLSLTNTTSTVILSAVIASVVSEIGLGSEPAFIVPDYDFRSATELPLYLLLGIFCGLVSLSLSWCTSWMMVATDKIQKTFAMPKAVFPVVGGFTVGLTALIYPEVLYWGFENVDTLLESRPFVKGLPVDILLQLVVVKIVATSFCRACGLVGGYYAPSLFIGAATGMAYGKVFASLISQLNPIIHLSGMEVASPQAYGLVGMAATLAGVCQVPLTAVLLLFELTHDYRIVLPLLGAVGLSSWITSRSTRRKDGVGNNLLKEKEDPPTQQPETLSYDDPNTLLSCNDELSLVTNNFDGNTKYMTKKLLVSQAMKTQYVTVLMTTMLTEVVALMLTEKQSCAMIVDDDNLLVGLLTLGEIQEFCKLSKQKNKLPQELTVSKVCSLNNMCQFPHTVTPMMNLYSAELIMNKHGTAQLPVISEHVADLPVGILDRESIDIACRFAIQLAILHVCLFQLLGLWRQENTLSGFPHLTTSPETDLDGGISSDYRQCALSVATTVQNASKNYAEPPMSNDI